MNIKDQIEQKIRASLETTYIEVINESAKHQGHAGDDGSGESHFKLKIVSPVFKQKSRLEQQRLIFDILKKELKQIHALSLELSES